MAQGIVIALVGFRGAMKITIVLTSVKEGGFAVTVPTLPGCFSYGKTKREALKNAREAISLYLKPTKEDLKGLKRGSETVKITV
jgi:predicted RNase H-like HicB family nuclease